VGREQFQTSLLLGKHEGKEESIIIIIELVSVNNSPFRWNEKTGGKLYITRKYCTVPSFCS
jgi:hypothetical protein